MLNVAQVVEIEIYHTTFSCRSCGGGFKTIPGS